jgi:hypothetical protein
MSEPKIHHCPKCNATLSLHQDDCDHCGAALDWSGTIPLLFGREKPFEKIPSSDKTYADITGVSGNVFAVLARCTRSLKRKGRTEEATELQMRIVDEKEAKDYDHALRIMMEYVDFGFGEEE